MTAPLDLDALEAVAREATQDWRRDRAFGQLNVQDEKFMLSDANAIYAAAANPAVVLALIERLRAAEAWISVNERRPTDHTKCYLVFSNWGIRLARKHEADWANGCFQDVDSDSDEGMLGWDESKGAFTVTHWRELPSIPAHGGNNAHS